MKDKALTPAKDRVSILEEECKQKDVLIMEVSSGVREAKNAANITTEMLLSSGFILDQVASSSRNDLLALADLEASLGLALYECEDLKGPSSVVEWLIACLVLK